MTCATAFAFSFSWLWDIAGMAVLGLVHAYVHTRPRHPPPTQRLNIRDVFRLDRFAVRFTHKGSQTASDVLVSVAVSFPWILWGYIDDIGALAVLEALAIIYESLLINSVISDVTKYLVVRPRPFHYRPHDDAGELHGRESMMSFYSSHTSNAFSATAALGMIYQAQCPQSIWVPLVWFVGIGLSTAVGVNRVLAGKHWPSDVFAGIVSGVGCGILVPWIHS